VQINFLVFYNSAESRIVPTGKLDIGQALGSSAFAARKMRMAVPGVAAGAHRKMPQAMPGFYPMRNVAV